MDKTQTSTAGQSLLARYQEIRRVTENLSKPLAVEDMVVQTMPDVSPAKWHLAHTTWFFETLVLSRASKTYRPFHPKYRDLFNSYYQAVGHPPVRAQRGFYSRPTVEEIYRYREHVDRAMEGLMSQRGESRPDGPGAVIETGLAHEEQHQELILTDIKHVYATNPLRPVYRGRDGGRAGQVPALGWKGFQGGLVAIGQDGKGFSYDNECPRHEVFLRPFRFASRLVTNGEYMAFIEDGGYRRPELWLSDGWDCVEGQGWSGPLYWEKNTHGYEIMTLAGLGALEESEPVCHASFFEAHAYARWAGARLATEAEWEVAAQGVEVSGNLLESGRLQPAPLSDGAPGEGPAQIFGDVWEWTSSSHVPYPGYRPPEGALGEYNGKFMSNQMVLRGGSCVTPSGHIRPTYRNFFHPEKRWQFSGIRLAGDV